MIEKKNKIKKELSDLVDVKVIGAKKANLYLNKNINIYFELFDEIKNKSQVFEVKNIIIDPLFLIITYANYNGLLVSQITERNIRFYCEAKKETNG